MSVVMTQIPPITSDVVGAICALSSVRSLNLLYAPVGCLAAVRASLDESYLRNPLYAAQMTELDAIMGMEDAFCNWVGELIQRHPEQELISLIGAPIPAVSGVNLKGIANRLEREYQLPVLTIEVTGFNSCYVGMHLVWMALANRFFQPPVQHKGIRVNILGASQFVLGSNSILDDLLTVLHKAEIEVNCILDSCGNINALSEFCAVDCNLVLSHEAFETARWVQHRYGIPYRFGLPTGNAGLRTFRNDLEDLVHLSNSAYQDNNRSETIELEISGKHVVVVAAPTVAASIRNSLLTDYDASSVTAVALSPSERHFRIAMEQPCLSNLIFTEEPSRLRALFDEADLVLADPVLQCLVEKAEFFPLSYPPLSCVSIRSHC